MITSLNAIFANGVSRNMPRAAKNALWNWVYIIIILSSFFSVILRSDIDSHVNLYRIFAVFGFLLLIALGDLSAKACILFVFIVVTSLLSSFIYSSEFYYPLIFLGHYFFIGCLILFLLRLYKYVAPIVIYQMLKYTAYSAIILFFIEYYFEFNLPNVADHYEDGTRSSFFWNQNELSSALVVFIPLMLMIEKNNFIKSWWLSLIIITFYLNDSKIAFISGIIICLLHLQVILLGGVGRRFFSIIFLMLIAAGLVLLADLNPMLKFEYYEISFEDLLVNPLRAIVNGDLLNDNGGSITSRANTIIYSIHALYESHFIGIGPGNSIAMLNSPSHFLKSAGSIHNLAVQILVEHGVLAVSLYLYVFVKYVRIYFAKSLEFHEKLYYLMVPAFFLGTAGSSAAAYSNYYMQTCLVFACLICFGPRKRRMNLFL